MSEAPALDEVESQLRSRLGEVEVTENHRDLVVTVPATKRPEALSVLKSLGFTYYSFCCGVDHLEEAKFEVFDHVHSIDANRSATLKCEVPRDDAHLPTGTGVFAGASWHERETWELFGITFDGHPELRRLLLPDWQEGYPMRKDFELAARVAKPWPGEFFEA